MKRILESDERELILIEPNEIVNWIQMDLLCSNKLAIYNKDL